jgi:hypothetical protein
MWPKTLVNEREISEFIFDISVDFVDEEFINEYYSGAAAILRLIPISELKEGPSDGNRPSKKKESTYNMLPLETMPPLVCQNGVVEDGNHRLRSARSRGATHVWCYEVIDKDLVIKSIKANKCLP